MHRARIGLAFCIGLALELHCASGLVELALCIVPALSSCYAASLLRKAGHFSLVWAMHAFGLAFELVLCI